MRKPLSRPGARRGRDFPNIPSASPAQAGRPERACGCSPSHRRPRVAPCRTPGCNPSPALALGLQPPLLCRSEPCEGTNPHFPARAPWPACQACFRRTPPSLRAEGDCGESEARVYAERVEVWYAQRLVGTLPRLRGRGKHRVEQRHVIDGLARKPGAFADSRYRADLFPSSGFRLAYDLLCRQQPARAAKEHLGILHLAARRREAGVAATLGRLLGEGRPLRGAAVEGELARSDSPMSPAEVTVGPVDLASDDALRQGQEAEDGEARGDAGGLPQGAAPAGIPAGLPSPPRQRPGGRPAPRPPRRRWPPPRSGPRSARRGSSRAGPTARPGSCGPGRSCHS
jgi:hypothetical protein